MITFKVKSTNGKNLEDFIRSLKFKKPLQKSKDRLEKDLDRNFDQQGALIQGGGFSRPGGAFANLGRATTRGSAWAPLAESTRRQRERLGYGAARPILQRTGKLRKGFAFKVDDKNLSATNDVSYARYHQFGTKNMPARVILGFSDRFVDTLKLEFVNYISDEIRRAK